MKWWAFFIIYGLTGVVISLALFGWLLDLPLGVFLVANFVFFFAWIRFANRVVRWLELWPTRPWTRSH